jgi:hypothetical protein
MVRTVVDMAPQPRLARRSTHGLERGVDVEKRQVNRQFRIHREGPCGERAALGAALSMSLLLHDPATASQFG